MKPVCLSVLLVEDEEDQRFLLERACRMAGLKARLCFARNGFEAQSYLEGDSEYFDRTKYPFPSFIITDLKMPRADGFYLLNFLRLHAEFRGIPTVVLSCSTEEKDIEAAYRLGAHAFHRKPASFDEFIALVRLIFGYWSNCELPRRCVGSDRGPEDLGDPALESIA